MTKLKKKSFIQKNGLIAVWAMAGFIAMGYISFLVTGAGDSARPGLADSSGSTATGAGQGKSAGVSKQVAALQAHVAELKSREVKLAQKLSRLEQTLGPITASIPNKAAKDGETSEANASASSKTKAPKKIKAALSGYGIDDNVEETIPPVAPPLNAKVSIKVLPLTEEDTVEAMFDSNVRATYGLNLATATTTGALERHWDYIKRGNPELVVGLTPRYISRGSKTKPLYALVAGPFTRKSLAEGRCRLLTQKVPELECRPARYDDDFQTQQQASNRVGTTK